MTDSNGATHTSAWLQAEVRHLRSPGVQYVHFDRSANVHSEAAGAADALLGAPVTPSTTFNANSIVKPLVVAATLRLARARALSLDDPIAHYLGRLVRNDHGATIRQTLMHTGGWPNPIPISWVHLASEHDTFDARAWRLALLRRHAVGGRPGKKQAYSNIGYLLVGQVLEAVTGLTPQAVVEREVIARAGLRLGEQLGFAAPDLALHARGNLLSLSLLNTVLGAFIDRKRFIAGRHGRWSQFAPFYVNGTSYGGLIANAAGLARFAMALLSSSSELLDATDRNVFLGTDPGAGTLGWFRGSLAGEPYLTHAGGGGGYYGELRLYPGLGRGSAILFNRTGLTDQRMLDRIDRAWIALTAG